MDSLWDFLPATKGGGVWIFHFSGSPLGMNLCTSGPWHFHAFPGQVWGNEYGQRSVTSVQTHGVGVDGDRPVEVGCRP